MEAVIRARLIGQAGAAIRDFSLLLFYPKMNASCTTVKGLFLIHGSPLLLLQIPGEQ
jgi:hypothetical protein